MISKSSTPNHMSVSRLRKIRRARWLYEFNKRKFGTPYDDMSKSERLELLVTTITVEILYPSKYSLWTEKTLTEVIVKSCKARNEAEKFLSTLII